MGANRQNIDVAFTIFSTTPEFGNIYTFINELFFAPLHGGIKLFFVMFLNTNTLLDT